MQAANSKPKPEISSKAVTTVIIGYTVTALGLVAFLTINGSSGSSQLDSVITLALIATGLLMPTAGLWMLRNGLNEIQAKVRRGLVLFGSGLIVLLSGLVFAVISSSLLGFLFGAVFLAFSGTLALAGTILLQKNLSNISGSHPRKVPYLIVGTILLFSGVVVILMSNLLTYSYSISQSFYTISQVNNSILCDVGATISAYGCFVSAYSFFSFKKSSS